MVNHRCTTCFVITEVVLLVSTLAGLFALNWAPTTILPFDTDDPTLQYPVLGDQIDGIGNVVGAVVISVGAMGCRLLCDTKTTGGRLMKHKIVLSTLTIVHGVGLVNLITHILKHYRGGLRPHFLAACQLNLTVVASELGQATWVDLFTSEHICTVSESVRARWSFPSGHSSNIFYGMVLSILIVNSCDTLWRKYPIFLPVKATVQFLMLTFATLVACSRLIDYHHHWYDVLAGAVLGTVLALVTHYWFLLPIMEMRSDSFTPVETDAGAGRSCVKRERHGQAVQEHSLEMDNIVLGATNQ